LAVFVDEKTSMRIFFFKEEGESNGLIVIKDDRICCKEKNGGVSSISFSYRIMARRDYIFQIIVLETIRCK
jgi:hypothetical protein